MPWSIGPVIETPDGIIWGAVATQGILSFDGKTWKMYTTDDGLYDNHVSFLTSSSDGDIWCRYGEPIFCEPDQSGNGPGNCIFGGVSRFDGEHWKTFGVHDGLLLNAVYAIAVAQNGNVCVSYEVNSGISLYNGETWETLSSKWGGDLTYGPDGVLWNVDIFAVDLRSYVAGKWTVYKGMPDIIFVYDITVDSNGTVWLSTSNGIIRFEPSTTNVESIETTPEKIIIHNNTKLQSSWCLGK